MYTRRGVDIVNWSRPLHELMSKTRTWTVRLTAPVPVTLKQCQLTSFPSQRGNVCTAKQKQIYFVLFLLGTSEYAFEGHHMMTLLRHWTKAAMWPAEKARYSCTGIMRLSSSFLLKHHLLIGGTWNPTQARYSRYTLRIPWITGKSYKDFGIDAIAKISSFPTV